MVLCQEREREEYSQSDGGGDGGGRGGGGGGGNISELVMRNMLRSAAFTFLFVGIGRFSELFTKA